MKRTEKTDKILVKYKQYLKLEKSLSDNTVDAYLTDLDKLLAYLTLENINILDVRLENLEDFSAGLHDIGFKIGVNFSAETRNIEKWIVE